MQLRRLTKYLHNIQEEERAFIAREIHDVLGQELTSMKMDLSWLNKKLTNENTEVNQQIDSLGVQIDKTIQTVREISSKLHPAILEDLGLRAAVEWQANEFEKRTAIKCKLDMPDETLGLNKEDTRSLYRIIQESLTNIMRHAEAENVDISIKKSSDVIQLIITDDGKGFSKTEKKDGHSFGLLGMNERAYSMEATLTIESEIYTGTTIHLNIPRKVEVL
jgi:signal transduction histidine kinase